MEIYLVRHTSVDVPPHYAYGHTDVPLKPTFEEEAEIVRQGLADHQFDQVYTSPLSRCVRLAAYCGYPDAKREDRIKEVNFGDWEMKSWDELSSDPRACVWFADWINQRVPQGESLRDQYERVSAFLNELRQSGQRKVCLFTHGGVLTCVRVYAGAYPLQDAFKNVPPYGSIISLIFD